jgi:hypothetical protein
MGTTPTIHTRAAARRRHRVWRAGRLVLVMCTAAVVAIVVAVAVVTPSRPTVEVVGDSITFFAGRDISAVFGHDDHVDVHAGIGRRIDEMLPALQTAVQQQPYAIVVDLGTNDARQAQTHPDWRSGFDRMIQLLLPARCAVVTTVSTLVAGQPGANAVAAAINDAIVAEVAVHPTLHVADWNAAVHGLHGTDLLLPDMVHPSAAGQLTLAALVHSALDHECPRA